MVLMMIVAVFVVMMMAVIMMMIVGLEERRLDLENTIEIEGIASQDLADIDLGALGAMQPRVRIESADPRLEFAQLLRSDQIGLVDQDDVGECNLILRLRRILETIRQPLGIGNR